MQLPKIDLFALPDLDQLTGVFGSLSPQAGGWSDDTLIVIMVFVYDTINP
jgi:hypothetical protein